MQNQNNQKISEFRFQKFHTPKDSQDFKMFRFKYVTPGLAENKRFHTFTALTASTMIWQKTALSDPMNLEDKDVLAMLVKVSWWVWWCSQKWRNRTCGRHAEHAKHANVMKKRFLAQPKSNKSSHLASSCSSASTFRLRFSWTLSELAFLKSFAQRFVHLRPSPSISVDFSVLDVLDGLTHRQSIARNDGLGVDNFDFENMDGLDGWCCTWLHDMYFLHQNEQWKHFRKMTHVEMEFQSFNSFDIILGLQLFYQSFKWTVNCGSDCWMDVVLHQLIGSFQPHTKRTPEVTSTSGQTKIDKTWWKKWRF